MALPPAMLASEFAGREREMDALARAFGVSCPVVLVEGEAGIGKSRLVAEFLASPAGQRQRPLVTRCPALREPHTLGPLTDAIRIAAGDVSGLGLSGLAGALRPVFPEWAPVLPPAPDPVEDASTVRHRLFRALAELVGCLRVTLLVVEDAHWADAATLEFLLFLLAQPATARCSLLITYRPEDVPPGSLLPRLSRAAVGPAGLRLALAPLAVAATGQLVASMLGSGCVSDEFATFLHERTEGVPLAVEELVRLLGERDDVARRDGHWIRRHLDEITVPPTVRDAVYERVQRLPADAQLMLRAAAVLAAPAAQATLAEITGLLDDRGRVALSEALASSLLAEDGRALVSYRHALAAQAVYDAITGPDRRLLHLRAGQLLEQAAAPPARLARHFREGGDNDAWSRYAGQAADMALASGDESMAQNLLTDLVLHAGLRAGVMISLVKKIPAASFLGREQQQGLERMLRSLLDSPELGPGEEADVRVQLGKLLTAVQEWGPARTELARSVPGLAHDPAQAARAMMLLAWPRASSCGVGEHLRWLRRADKLAGSLGPAQQLQLLVDKTSALLMLGQQTGWAEATRIPEDSRQPVLRQHIVRGHMNIGDQAIKWGKYEEAARRLAKAGDLAERHHYLRMREAIRVGLLHLHWFTGRWDGLAEQAVLLAGDPDIHQQARAEAAMITGLWHAAAGAGAVAEEYLTFALADAPARHEADYAAEVAAGLARLRLADGRAGDALQVVAEPIRVVAAKGIWVWASDLAMVTAAAMAAAGRLGEADDLVRSFARGLRARHAPAPLAALAVCRATLAQAREDHARAALLFAHAAAAWQRLPRPYDAMLAREQRARCLIANGQTEAGLTALSHVFSDLSGLGATRDAGRVRLALRHHGVDARPPARGGRPGYGDRLSPRELQVARLLLDGRTNRQIAEALVVSTQTVANHLHSAMRKLDVPSRTALAVRCSELGIVSRSRTTPPGIVPAHIGKR